MGTNFSSDNRAVANFVSNKSEAKKKPYSKNVKSGRDNRKCLICERVGHLVVDCRDPRKAAWIEKRRNRDNKTNQIVVAVETRANALATGAATEAEARMLKDHITIDRSSIELG